MNSAGAKFLTVCRIGIMKMVLRYMITASDLVNLAEDKIAKSQPTTGPQKQSRGIPKKRLSMSIKGLGFCVVLVAGVIIWASANRSVAGRNLRIWDFLAPNRLAVTGIMCNSQSRSALVRGKVVHEGDTVGKYKVVRISKDGVEFEKDGNIIMKRPGR
jgi:hypothetical protein